LNGRASDHVCAEHLLWFELNEVAWKSATQEIWNIGRYFMALSKFAFLSGARCEAMYDHARASSEDEAEGQDSAGCAHRQP
jgi:hypothetical protein